jgi:hypothetical protein
LDGTHLICQLLSLSLNPGLPLCYVACSTGTLDMSGLMMLNNTEIIVYCEVDLFACFVHFCLIFCHTLGKLNLSGLLLIREFL